MHFTARSTFCHPADNTMSQYNAYILVNAAAKIKEFKEFSGKLYHTMQILTS